MGLRCHTWLGLTISSLRLTQVLDSSCINARFRATRLRGGLLLNGVRGVGGGVVELGVRAGGWESSGVTKICGVSVRPGVGGDAERGVAVSTTVAAVPGVLFKGDGEGVGGGVGVGSGEYDGGGMAGDTGDGGQTRFVGGGDSELTGRTSRTSRNL